MFANCSTGQSIKPLASPAIDPLAFYQALWNDPGLGMYVLEVLAGGEDFRFAAFNAVTAAQSPVPVESLLGKPLCEAFPASIAEAYRQHYCRCLQSAQPLAFDEKLPTAAGDTWWNLRVYPLRNPAGEIHQLLVMVADITAKRKTEVALEDSRQVLQQVIDTMPSMIFWKDRQSRYLGCNQAFAEVAGKQSSADIVGLDDYELPWKPEETEWFRDWDRRVMESNLPELDIVEPQLQAGGRSAWVRTSKIPLRSAEGTVTGILGVVEDITDRKEVQDQQERLLAILEATPDVVGITDAVGNHRYLNRAGQLIFNIKPEQIGLFHISDTTHAEAANMLIHEALPMAMEKGSWRGESVIYDCHGREIPVSQVIICHKGAEGRPEYFSSIMRDISDRKAAEAILRETAERQAVLNEITTKIRNSLDLDTVIAATLKALHQGLKLDYCGFAWLNPSVPHWQVIQAIDTSGCHLELGSRPDDRLCSDLQRLVRQEIVALDDAADCPFPHHKAFLDRLGIRAEILIPIPVETHKIGVIVGYYTGAAHHWQAGEIELLRSVGDQLVIAINQANLYTQSAAQAQALEQSLRQLQQTQSQMVQSEKMSSLGQMVAGVAHEINNPVNFIHGNLQPAQEYAQDLLRLVGLYQAQYPDPPAAIAAAIDTIELDYLREDLPQLLSSMELGTQRIREIVLSLRNFSRLDESSAKTVDLHEGIDSTLVILNHRLKGNAADQPIEVIKHYGHLPPVDCYPGQLNQVFMNILANAIDALDHHCQPQITITTALKGQPSEPDSRAIIRIRDNGPGIPLDIQPRILDPFFTTKPVGQGTGMGMSISYQIITESHRGELMFSSSAESGTEFMISIPLRQQASLKANLRDAP